MPFNNNIWCIEILVEEYHLDDFDKFNNNIWCIEIRSGTKERNAVLEFNNNIWCIEIYIQSLLDCYL